MLAYTTPGVYFEWLDTRSPALVPLRTDIAGFVGIAAAGPLQTPIKVESMTQFASVFGAHTPQAYLAYAVEGFFANGGQTCWVVRVADDATARQATFDMHDESGTPTLRLRAISRVVTSEGVARVYPNPGTSGEQITFSVSLITRDRFTLILRLGNAREIWRDLSLRTDDARYVEHVINGQQNGLRLIDKRNGSRLVEAQNLFSPAGFPANTPDPAAGNLKVGLGRLAAGADGLRTLTLEQFTGGGSPAEQPWGLAALAQIDEVSIVAMPDIMPKDRDAPAQQRVPLPDCASLCREPEPPPLPDEPLEFAPDFSNDETLFLQRALVAHCETLKDRVAILDPPILDPHRDDLSQQRVAAWRTNFDTKYAALYFPWVLVPDPLRLRGLLRAVPPSGHIAGVYARGDRRVGVHKPPANAELELVKDVCVQLDDIAHGDLNEQGVNCIREFRGRGVRVAGARTLSSDAEWRFVNVRRLLIMIEEAIDEQTQWTVFEPNNPDLWREVDRVARNFLGWLWRRGMLDGATSEEAYSVRCDETTNTPEETDAGRMICQIGVLPPWPAEFVVVRIGKTESGTEILESKGGQSG